MTNKTALDLHEAMNNIQKDMFERLDQIVDKNKKRKRRKATSVWRIKYKGKFFSTRSGQSVWTRKSGAINALHNTFWIMRYTSGFGLEPYEKILQKFLTDGTLQLVEVECG